MKKIAFTAAVCLPLISSVAFAEPVVGIAVSAPATVGTVAAGAGIGVVAHELMAKKPFGPNGEGMKAGRGVCRAFFKKC